MPRVKVFNWLINTAGQNARFSTQINVNSEGVFYSDLSSEYLDALAGAALRDSYKRTADKVRLCCDTLTEMERILQTTFELYAAPVITIENVIKYSIASHVSFATDPAGNIFPNAGYPNTTWSTNDERYGGHHANNPSIGGYSLTVGARAYTKTTHTYGEHSASQYESYYKGGSHLSHTNPAQILNSWGAFTLPKSSKEIPYSDEAAIFFHELMTGMANISKLIQENTFTTDHLLNIISSGQRLCKFTK
jgi:hypothetical protein